MIQYPPELLHISVGSDSEKLNASMLDNLNVFLGGVLEKLVCKVINIMIIVANAIFVIFFRM